MFSNPFIIAVIIAPFAVNGLACLMTLYAMHGLHEMALVPLMNCDACLAVVLFGFASAFAYVAAFIVFVHWVRKKFDMIGGIVQRIQGDVLMTADAVQKITSVAAGGAPPHHAAAAPSHPAAGGCPGAALKEEACGHFYSRIENN